MKYYSKNLTETNNIAKQLLDNCKSKIILLNGEIGVGKTTIVQFMAKHLGITEIVNSPTFVIMKVYNKLIHIDAYRISGNLEEYEDFFEEKLVVIEWADNLELDFNHYMKVNAYMENNKHVYEVVENV